MSDEILTVRHGRVLVIAINRPEWRNAVNLGVSQGQPDTADELDENWDLSVEHIMPIFTSNDAKEGAMAFAEKRKPNWTGT